MKLWNCLTLESQQKLINIMQELDPNWKPNYREPVEIDPKEIEREMKKIPRSKHEV